MTTADDIINAVRTMTPLPQASIDDLLGVAEATEVDVKALRVVYLRTEAPDDHARLLVAIERADICRLAATVAIRLLDLANTPIAA